jgi:hypothetical protein
MKAIPFRARYIALAYSVLMIAGMCTQARAQTTLSVEYDFHHNHQWGTNSSYGAVGLSQGTKYGIFDGYLQGSYNNTHGDIDSLNGWEFGYSYAIPVGKFTVTPRIAYGAMNNIGGAGNARYALTTLEGSYPIRDGLSTFANISHTFGLNDAAIKSWNRATAGIDYSLTKNTSLRLGASYIRQLQTDQFGAYSIVSYTLN